MKNLMIKIIVVVLAISAYFNISQFINIRTLHDRNETLEGVITDLENIDNSDDETCNKLYDITIQVVSEDDNLNHSISHCTNKVYLGDALDEISDDMGLGYDPRYSKDYIYGRLIVSLYGVTSEYEEYFQITINDEYANTGIDYIELVDNYSYEFTLVRWS